MGYKFKKKIVSIFGITGSVGTSTQDILKLNKDKFIVDTIVAKNNVEGLIAAAILLNPKLVIISNTKKYVELKEGLEKYDFEIASGDKAILDASRRKVDILVAAIIGYAGLITTYSSVGYAKTIALANKESLVCGGPLLITKAKQKKCNIIPLDSEHNTLFQILNAHKHNDISRIIITASGGPFRGYSYDQLNKVTPAEAIAHPIWNMGKKISIDSATLMNKGLELIEAFYLFHINQNKIDIIVHPESIIHGIVEYNDGSMNAGLSTPDMRTPISYALNYPNKINNNVKSLKLTALKSLNFKAVDNNVFKAINISRNALDIGHSAVICLNAVNEITVDAFLNKKINFNAISNINEMVISNITNKKVSNIDDIVDIDIESRKIASEIISTGKFK